jgi:succinate dehydrogenase / fumarate reductase membrane anchor subunit
MSGLSGLRAWVVQRLSALYIAGFVLVSLGLASVYGVPAGFEDWRALWSCTLPNVAAQLFVLALLLHAWVGVRDIFIDYIHPTGLRLTALGLLALFLAGCAFWAARVMLRLLEVS